MKKIYNQNISLKMKSGNWLAFLRISIALFAILHFTSIQADFENLYAFSGYVQPDIQDVALDNLSPTIFDIYTYIQKYFSKITYEHISTSIKILYYFFLFSLVLGFLTRINAVLALLCQIILLKSIHFFQYGADFFTTMLLFYCVIFPVGRFFSLDNILFKQKESKTSSLKFLRLLQIHICIVYFIGGFEKLLGFNWRNGEAIWKTVTDYNILGILNMESFNNTGLFLIGGWVVICIEMLYPIFININKTRTLWLTLVISFHLSIILFMGLFFFSTIMILFNITAYYIPYLKEEEQKEQDIKPNRLSQFFSKIKSINLRKMFSYE